MDEQLKSQSGLNGTVDVEFNGKMAILRMRCGENRFNISFFKKLQAALDEVEKSEAAVLITTGEGKFYSNGIDLDWVLQATADIPHIGTIITKEFHSLVARILTFPMVTIALINGHAFAGGAVLSVAHDYRVMNSEKGWWCLNEVFLGLFFSPFLRAFMKMKIPNGVVADEAIVLGQRFTSQRALQSGIVQVESTQTQLISTAVELGKKLTASQPYPRQSLANMKADIYKESLDKINQIDPSKFSHL